MIYLRYDISLREMIYAIAYKGTDTTDFFLPCLFFVVCLFCVDHDEHYFAVTCDVFYSHTVH